MAAQRILALFGGVVLYGQERANIEALASLRDQGCRILCLVRDERRAVRIPRELASRGLRFARVAYIEHRLPGRLRHFLFRNPIAFLRANREMGRIIRSFQPTHIHAFNALYVLNFMPSLVRHRVPMIYRAGDEPTVHNLAWSGVWRFVVWRTSQFVANSRFVAEALERNGVASERISVIYNKPPERPRSAGNGFLVREGWTNQSALYVGQISQHKGVQMLVEAFRLVAERFPEAELLIAGRVSTWRGDAWARALRDRTAGDPVIGRRVSFLGETQDVDRLLSQCSFLVVPSLFDDPSPNVVMEAKQAARPSIVFPVGGIPELVTNGVDGLICEGTTARSLAKELGRYLGNPSLAREHGLAARDSLTRLGVPNFSNRWFEVYRAAGKSNRSQRPVAAK